MNIRPTRNTSLPLMGWPVKRTPKREGDVVIQTYRIVKKEAA